MKISYNWLKDYVTTLVSPKELADKLTMVGLAVDSVERSGDDWLLDIDLTSNRPDALCHIGVAREAALVSGVAIKRPELLVPESDERVEKYASVEIDSPDLCPRYAARV